MACSRSALRVSCADARLLASWWGVVARESYDGLGDPDGHKHPGIMSMYCGRQIRAAWVTGQPR